MDVYVMAVNLDVYVMDVNLDVYAMDVNLDVTRSCCMYFFLEGEVLNLDM